jgi:hypothetical protein
MRGGYINVVIERRQCVTWTADCFETLNICISGSEPVPDQGRNSHLVIHSRAGWF